MNTIVPLHPPKGVAADRERVLTTAALRAADALHVNGRDLAAILGTSEAMISRLKNGAQTLRETGKSFELAALFIRLYRSLDAIPGGDIHVARTWLRNPNTALGGVPLAQIKSITGLVQGLTYVDARRAPL